MPQGPLSATIATEAGKNKPAALDGSGNLVTGLGLNTTLGITTSTVVALGPVRISKAVLQAAGSTATVLYDSATIAGALTTTQISSLATSQVTPVSIDWPCLQGLVVIPGTGATVAVSTK
jgi:hypothetical protein